MRGRRQARAATWSQRITKVEIHAHPGIAEPLHPCEVLREARFTSAHEVARTAKEAPVSTSRSDFAHDSDEEDSVTVSPGTVLEERVTAYFRHAIENRLLRPGDRLPSERDLAHKLNVSRDTVRHSIGYLAAMGVVHIHGGVGTFVADGPPAIGKAEIAALGLLHRFQSWHIFEARRILECTLAMLAAERGRERDFTKLAAEVAEMFATYDDPAEFRIHEVLFHRVVANAAGNPILAALMETVASALYAQEATGDSLSQRDAADIHCEIYRAIRSRNGARAAELMTQHLREAEEGCAEHPSAPPAPARPAASHQGAEANRRSGRPKRQ